MSQQKKRLGRDDLAAVQGFVTFVVFMMLLSLVCLLFGSMSWMAIKALGLSSLASAFVGVAASVGVALVLFHNIYRL